MAKLQRIVEKAAYGALPSAVQGLYAERDGKFYLDVDDAEGLTQSLEAARQEKRALEARLAGYGDLAPEQVRELQEAAARAQRDVDVKSGNFDKILQETQLKHQKDLELRDGSEKRLRESLKNALIDSEAVRELAAQGGNADLLLPIIQRNATLQTVGDREVAVIIGEKGGPRLKAGAKGADDFMPMSEYVAELKADKRYAGAFNGPPGSGSGGQRPATRTGTIRQQVTGKIAQAIRDGATVISE